MPNFNEVAVKKMQSTITTVEVAEMMGVEHKEILKKLEGTKKPDGSAKQIGVIPVLAKGDFPLSDYFIESTYTDSSGKKNKCYNCTKMGCELLANKFTGEKGIIFSAKYVEKFNKMENVLEKQQANVRKLSHKQELVLDIYDGGSKAIVAHKELVKIEVAEEIAKLKDGTNKILSAKQVVEMLGISKLTTMLLHEWFVENGFGELIRFPYERNRVFQPSKKFVDYVAVKGYSFTGTTVKGNKIKVVYSTAMVDRLMDKHMASIVQFVKLKNGVA